MDFSLDYSAEQKAFAEQVTDWLQHNFPDDLKLPPDPGKLPPEQYEKLRNLGRKLGDRGWLAPTFPREYGGGGLPLDLAMVIELELDKRGVALPPYSDLGLSLAAPAILVRGTEQQKKRFLPQIMSGQVVTWQLFTEPDAGSDLAAVRTSATRVGHSYVITGQKIFVGSLYKADQFWLLACTDPGGERHRNLSMFLVPSDLRGITVTRLDLIAAEGDRWGRGAGAKNMVFLDNVEVPELNLIGGDNNGWLVANTTLELEQGGAGSITKRGEVEKLIGVCRNDPQARERIRLCPELLGELVDLYAAGEIERLFALRNYWLRHSRGRRTYEGNQYALWRKLLGVRASWVALRLLGPAALVGDSEVALEEGLFEWRQRGSIVTAPGGTIDIQKVRMARRLGIGRAIGEEPVDVA